MKKLRAVLAVVIVLSLLVAAVGPVYAGKPGPGGEKSKETPPGQAKAKKNEAKKQPKEPQGPADDPEPDDSNVETVTLCHKPGTPAQKTLELPEAAVPGHLNHGDTLGLCPETVPVIPVPSEPVTVTLCHKPGTPAEKTLELPETAVPGHVNHGDTLGPCPETAPVTWGVGMDRAAGWWPLPGFVWQGLYAVML